MSKASGLIETVARNPVRCPGCKKVGAIHKTIERSQPPRKVWNLIECSCGFRAKTPGQV